jgi:hypothetical protein
LRVAAIISQKAACFSARVRAAHQLEAAAESGDDGEVRGGCNEEKPEMGENLTKVALRGQVDAHSHVVEDNKGDERGCNLETEGRGGGRECEGERGNQQYKTAKSRSRTRS